jgi:hypothetical protein
MVRTGGSVTTGEKNSISWGRAFQRGQLQYDIDFSHLNTDWLPYYKAGLITMSSDAGEKYLHERKHYGPDPAYGFSYKATIGCLATPVVGQPVIQLFTRVDITGQFNASIYDMPKSMFEAIVKSQAKPTANSSVSFHQVDDAGRMVVSVKRESLETPCEVDAHLNGITTWIPRLSKLLMEIADVGY